MTTARVRDRVRVRARPSSRPGLRVVVAVLSLAGTTGLAACGADDGGAASAGAVASAAGSPVLASAAEVAALLAQPPAGMTLVDVRTPEEFAAGHLEGARLIDFQGPMFLDEIGRLERDAPVVVYCRSGNRSAQAVAAMVQLGFTDVVELDGGVIAWEAAGLPFVTG